jgi:circadian clock protein KaiB
MSESGQSPGGCDAQTRDATYVLRLFVAGEEANSQQALENLTALCEERLDGCFEIDVVDVLVDFQAALDNSVLVTPTLIVVAPPPPVTVVGTLSDTDKLLSALRLS